jgi:hypothetical protein
MQRQLAALHIGNVFLAPCSWPLCKCLTAVRLHLDSGTHCNEYLAAALQAPELTELDIEGLDLLECPAFVAAALGNLTSLTSLSILGSGDDPEPPPQPLFLDAIQGLSSLQRLAHDDWLVGKPASWLPGVEVPACWSRLTQLKSVHASFCSMQLASLSVLQSLEKLQAAESRVVGGLQALFPLTALTELEVTAAYDERGEELEADDEDDEEGEEGEEEQAVEGANEAAAADPYEFLVPAAAAAEAAAAADAAALLAVADRSALEILRSMLGAAGNVGAAEVLRAAGVQRVPLQWTERLQVLSWPEGSVASLSVVSQLSSLTSLKLEGVCVSPEFCRCATAHIICMCTWLQSDDVHCASQWVGQACDHTTRSFARSLL